MAIEMECLCVFIRMEDTLIYILALMKINRIVVYLVNFREEKSFYRYVLLQIFSICLHNTAAVGDKRPCMT